MGRAHIKPFAMVNKSQNNFIFLWWTNQRILTPNKGKINLTLAVLSRRIIDTGHSICIKNKHYRTINSVGTPIYFGKGTKCMVIEAFDKTLYATIEDSIFSLEEIPEVQLKSENFDKILPVEPKKIYIPRMMIHPFKRQLFEKFVEKQNLISAEKIRRSFLKWFLKLVIFS